MYKSLIIVFNGRVCFIENFGKTNSLN